MGLLNFKGEINYINKFSTKDQNKYPETDKYELKLDGILTSEIDFHAENSEEGDLLKYNVDLNGVYYGKINSSFTSDQTSFSLNVGVDASAHILIEVSDIGKGTLDGSFKADGKIDYYKSDSDKGYEIDLEAFVRVDAKLKYVFLNRYEGPEITYNFAEQVKFDLTKN